MIRIEIKNVANHITNLALKPTQEEAERWVIFEKFNVNPTEVYEFDLQNYGYDKNNMPPEIPFVEVEAADGRTFKLYSLPPTQFAVYTDISAEIEIEQQQQESTESFQLVEKLKSYIRWLNKKKLRDGIWTQQTFINFIQSPIIANAERALNQASWSTYKGLVIQASAFYTAQEMTYIIGLVEQHELKWQSVLGG